MDTRTFDNSFETNIAELEAYSKPFKELCEKAEVMSDHLIARPVLTFCRWWTMRDPLLQFDTVRIMNEADRINRTSCPDNVDFPRTLNVPWWYIR
jgi:hypothetical protein